MHHHHKPTRSIPFWLILASLTASIFGAIVLAVSVGAVAIPFGQVVQIILSHLLPQGAIAPNWTPTADRIVWVFRLPRVLLAIVVGAALSVSGTTLQAVARNPLADPFLFGVSYGATVGAVLVLTLEATTFGGLSLSIAAFTGALIAMVLVYALAQQQGQVTSFRLVLAGVALSYVLSAVTSYLVLRSSQPGNNSVGLVLSWLAGSFGRAQWADLGLPSIVVVLMTGHLILQSRSLNALLMGDEHAVALGINVKQLQLQLFVITSLLVGVVVAVSGAIGFVGLMIPHIVRMSVGSDHRRVLPIAALGGGLFMVLMDLIGRIAVAPEELPVGIVTAAFGGPFFLWLLRQRSTFGGDFS
ncbi:MAG: iron ABC transporter permease [Leptolyngbyaceae cyanobacterium SM1_3_5]|nr:iron ABC transporter permease [Leptolyngbyaceae cyanobacterium SM1_3_5]